MLPVTLKDVIVDVVGSFNIVVGSISIVDKVNM